jgi:hypothetical protein
MLLSYLSLQPNIAYLKLTSIVYSQKSISPFSLYNYDTVSKWRGGTKGGEVKKHINFVLNAKNGLAVGQEYPYP